MSLINENNNYQSRSAESLSYLSSTGVELLSSARRSIKAIKKWASRGQVVQFIVSHPVTTKVYFVTEFLSIVDLVAGVKKPQRQSLTWRRPPLDLFLAPVLNVVSLYKALSMDK